ncbi:MAG: RDD family protein, partial [Actinobacteria bacterium]|nr:RDD family protein [Actinomycetota bacterium]
GCRGCWGCGGYWRRGPDQQRAGAACRASRLARTAATARGPSTGYAAVPPATAGAACPGPPASVGNRFLAFLLDSLLAVALLYVVVVIVMVGPWAGEPPVWVVVLVTLWLLVVVVLAIVPLGRLGQTIGKRVRGIKVVDARTAATVGIGRAFLRQVVWALLALPCYLGYITYFTDSSGRNRALHEQAAATVTVAVPRVGLFRSIADAVRSLRP